MIKDKMIKKPAQSLPSKQLSAAPQTTDLSVLFSLPVLFIIALVGLFGVVIISKQFQKHGTDDGPIVFASVAPVNFPIPAASFAPTPWPSPRPYATPAAQRVETAPQNIPQNTPVQTYVPLKNNTGGVCHGFLSKTDYLDFYIVADGDSITSIAQNVLGDSRRTGELVTLNEPEYPGLSINTEIKKGWRFSLPPKNLGKTNGMIYVVSGTLKKSDKGWGVGWTNSGTGPFRLEELPQGLENGDCVIVVYEGGTSPRVASVEKQEQ